MPCKTLPLVHSNNHPFIFTGNANESGLHWDMVCDLRRSAPGGSGGGGTITVDGEVISRDGKFVFDDWPGNE